MSYNGYEAAGSFEACAQRAKTGKRDSEDDLRNELFFAARASRHCGDDNYLKVYREIYPLLQACTDPPCDGRSNRTAHRWIVPLIAVMLLYFGLFITLRATGIYYAYFSQGSWELEYTGFDPAEEGSLWGALDDPVFIIFSPLWAVDQSLLHLYNEEPTGG
jgi:hypothetical protein